MVCNNKSFGGRALFDIGSVDVQLEPANLLIESLLRYNEDSSAG